ncbi:uncharacterized protein [Pyxicephalus adspersus]|uniref:uncharacterized protein isoform X2 n=1 Tax=Pyxicephalus adspersus TaxID=30357 RepID=UPI003B5CFC96
MEDASVAHCDESPSEDNNRPANSVLLDIVNGCNLAHTASLAKAVASDHFRVEGNVKSEDFLNNNNNKEVSEQGCFTNQKFVSSGDFTISDQISAEDNPQDSFLASSVDRNSAKYKETLNHLHDSCQTTDKGKEARSNEQSIRPLSNYTLKGNIGKDISGSNEKGEQQNAELKKDIHSLCQVEFLTLQENPESKEESDATESLLSCRPKATDSLAKNNFTDYSINRDFIDEVTKFNNKLTRESLDHRPQDCVETNAENNVINYALSLKSSKCDIASTKQKAISRMEHCDKLSNTVCESEDCTKNCSLDFQSKRFGLGLPKNDVTRRSKHKKEHRSLKCRRLQPVSHELEFVEEEDLSEKEESSEEENMDSSFHYSCSKDGFDHRKERHQYVSDKLDPDVLQLLEMHLRKQQLVDIKEEGEEEMLDVHINKDKSRSDSYKLLRNISPVLDMVLEEPELEHAGDTLEEDSKTPSDIDSDDSSNVCSMELGLMESLQFDLMSKSSKIDKQEIATILQGPSPDCLAKRKQKEGASCRTEYKPRHGNLQNKEPNAHEVQVRGQSDLQVIPEDGPEDVESGSLSEDADDSQEDNIDTQSQPESSFSDSLKDVPEPPSALNEKETGIMEPFQATQSSELASMDIFLDSNSQNVTIAATEVSEIKLSDSYSFNGSETDLPDSESVNVSGSPCPINDENVKPHKLSLGSRIPYEETDSCNPSNEGDNKKENDSPKQLDGGNKVMKSQETNITDVSNDQNIIKTKVKSETESSFSGAPLCITADMNTLQENIKQKILSLLEKAHAADCRSSHLQAEAELLFKESIELRNECKSLSKEAAELLSIVTQQEVLHRHQKRQSQQDPEAEGSTSNSIPRDKKTLSFVSKRTSKKKKEESQLQVLSKKYDFLRQEAPEIMRELHVLQQDLKNVPSHHNKVQC